MSGGTVCVNVGLRPHESGALTDDEIEQLADLSLEAKAFGHFVICDLCGSIDRSKGTRDGTDTKFCARRGWR